MTHYEKTEKTNRIFDGKIIKLDLLQVRLENGKLAEREIVTHPGGVGIVAVTEDKELYLVKQFRKPYDEEVLEIPAGKLEKGERPELCAQRELKEETGLTAASFTLLTEMYPSPGYTDEIIRIFKAEGLNQGEIELDEDEFLDVHIIKLEDAVGMIKRGEIKDAKTIIGILMIASEM